MSRNDSDEHTKNKYRNPRNKCKQWGRRRPKYFHVQFYQRRQSGNTPWVVGEKEKRSSVFHFFFFPKRLEKNSSRWRNFYRELPCDRDLAPPPPPHQAMLPMCSSSNRSLKRSGRWLANGLPCDQKSTFD